MPDTISLQSRADCRRIDAAIMQALAARGLSERSPAPRVLAALEHISTAPPVWCPKEAWETLCRYTAEYALAHGSLEVRVRLARMKEQ